MLTGPMVQNGGERVSLLRDLTDIRGAEFDRLTRLAGRLFDAEIAIIAFSDRGQEWYKSHVSLDIEAVPRALLFSDPADAKTCFLYDLRKDSRFDDRPPNVNGKKIEFVAREPLRNGVGVLVGTLCVMSAAARSFSPDDEPALQDLGRMVELTLENRRLSETQSALLNSLVEADLEKRKDPLTGLWNRRGLDELFEREISRVTRENLPLVVAMADIDHFKRVNDTFGHQIGDEALKLAANLLRNNVRKTDIVARYGGEEFVQILPGISADFLPSFANKIMAVFREGAEIRIPGQKEYRFTISLGLAIMPVVKDASIEREALIRAADRAMYAAKHDGRDRFHILRLEPSE